MNETPSTSVANLRKKYECVYYVFHKINSGFNKNRSARLHRQHQQKPERINQCTKREGASAETGMKPLQTHLPVFCYPSSSLSSSQRSVFSSNSSFNRGRRFDFSVSSSTESVPLHKSASSCAFSASSASMSFSSCSNSRRSLKLIRRLSFRRTRAVFSVFSSEEAAAFSRSCC